MLIWVAVIVYCFVWFCILFCLIWYSIYYKNHFNFLFYKIRGSEERENKKLKDLFVKGITNPNQTNRKWGATHLHRPTHLRRLNHTRMNSMNQKKLLRETIIFGYIRTIMLITVIIIAIQSGVRHNINLNVFQNLVVVDHHINLSMILGEIKFIKLYKG